MTPFKRILHSARRIAFGLVMLGCLAYAQDEAASFPQPSSDLAPQDVVRIQVEALGNNDDPYPDAGIEITFAFASPSNQQVTGPLERFITLVKNPTYRDMINHIGADYGPVEIIGERALQSVVLTTPDGRRVGYLFGLSLQRGNAFEGMWMTDSVVRFEVPDSDTV